MVRRDAFHAIADPTRREIIQLVAKEPLNVNAVADNFSISRPAISKHVKILEECGLVQVEKKGRERICKAKLDSLQEVSDWVTQYKQFWTESFDALDAYLKQIQKEED